MRADFDHLDGETIVYPGHPITLAYLITFEYASLEAATLKGAAYPLALENSRIPGAGGNVYNAIDLLRRVRQGVPIEDALLWADQAWGYCDAQARGGNDPDDPKFGRDHYIARWKKGQEQADKYKERLRERLAGEGWGAVSP